MELVSAKDEFQPELPFLMQLVSGRDEFQPTPAHFNATRLYQRRVQAKLFFFFHLIISHNISNGNSIRAKTRELKHKHATRLYKRRVPRSNLMPAQDAYCQLRMPRKGKETATGQFLGRTRL
jgi:hypothetical protein